MTESKCDLQIGKHLDDIGGFKFHTVIEHADITYELDTLPVGIAPYTKINRSIKAGEITTWDDILLDKDHFVF